MQDILGKNHGMKYLRHVTLGIFFHQSLTILSYLPEISQNIIILKLKYLKKKIKYFKIKIFFLVFTTLKK